MVVCFSVCGVFFMCVVCCRCFGDLLLAVVVMAVVFFVWLFDVVLFACLFVCFGFFCCCCFLFFVLFCFFVLFGFLLLFLNYFCVFWLGSFSCFCFQNRLKRAIILSVIKWSNVVAPV